MPLRRVGWGLVLALLDLTIEGVDLLPDVLGWALVASGLGRLVPLPDARGRVLLARRGAWVAATVAVLIWLLAAAQEGSDLLRGVEFVVGGVVLVLVADALAAVAGAAGAEADRRTWRTVRLWLAGCLVLGSVVMVGAVVADAESAAGALVVVALVNVLVSLVATWTAFKHAGRSWASAVKPPAAPSAGSVRSTVPPPA